MECIPPITYANGLTFWSSPYQCCFKLFDNEIVLTETPSELNLDEPTEEEFSLIGHVNENISLMWRNYPFTAYYLFNSKTNERRHFFGRLEN